MSLIGIIEIYDWKINLNKTQSNEFTFWTFHNMNVLLLKLPATKVENPVNKNYKVKSNKFSTESETECSR